MTHPLTVMKVEYLITRRCEYRCKYCRIIDDSSLRGPEMDTGSAIRTMRLIAERWPGAPVAILGGEPTVRDDLPEVVAAGVEAGIHVIVISNSKRVLADEEYRERLVDAGLRNWSCSYDGNTPTVAADKSSLKKSLKGLRALRMFRDQYGFEDLVASIAVTRRNIGHVEGIVRMLSSEGIWSIVCPCQTAKPGYQYSAGDTDDLPSPLEFEEAGAKLAVMAQSGLYKMHNGPAWFEGWSKYGYTQDWVCEGKNLLTVDADGSLRRCIEIPLEEDIHVLDLAALEGRERYAETLVPTPKCQGCFWDCAYETQGMRESTLTEKGARKHFRHEE